MKMRPPTPAFALVLVPVLLAACASASGARPETRVRGAASLVPEAGPADATPAEPARTRHGSRIDPELEALLFVLANRARTGRGLGSLELRGDLIGIARRHALDMAGRGYFSHYTPEGAGPGDRARAGGVRYGAFAENLARVRHAVEPAGLAVDAWLESPGHRRNLLDEGRIGYRYTGVGVAIAPDGTVLLSQVFLR